MIKMGYFPSLNGEAKNVYQQIKGHQEYKEIFKCFIVDECVDGLIGKKNFKYRKDYWYDTAKLTSNHHAENRIKDRIAECQLMIYESNNCLNKILENPILYSVSTEDNENLLPKLSDDAKALYFKLKDLKSEKLGDYQDVLRNFELDECFDSLEQDKGESWSISYAGDFKNWKYIAEYYGRYFAEEIFKKIIKILKEEIDLNLSDLNSLYENWNEFPNQYNKLYEQFLKNFPEATLEQAFWYGYSSS
jgi:hypothetical protein